MTNLIKNSFFILVSFSLFVKVFVASLLSLFFVTNLVQHKLTFLFSAPNPEDDPTLSIHEIIYSSATTAVIEVMNKNKNYYLVEQVSHNTEGLVNYTDTGLYHMW
jgi:hypothetical protein